MKKYSNDNDITRSIKATAADQGVTLADLAARLGLSPQAFSNRLSRKHYNFDAVAAIADALGYDLYFDFQRRPGK